MLKFNLSLLRVCWESVGSLLGGCWEAAGRLLGGCWEAAGRLLGGCWEAAGSFFLTYGLFSEGIPCKVRNGGCFTYGLFSEGIPLNNKELSFFYLWSLY
jgi:hypothetical protein